MTEPITLALNGDVTFSIWNRKKKWKKSIVMNQSFFIPKPRDKFQSRLARHGQKQLRNLDAQKSSVIRGEEEENAEP